MITNEQIVEAAREYLNTPFRHCGRAKGYGVDCIGLVAGVAQQLGITQHDLKAYSRFPDGETLVREFEKCLTSVGTQQAKAGDVPVFWYTNRNMPCHAGIFTPTGIIHTYATVGKVTEHRVDGFWQARLVRVFRYPTITFTDTRKLPWQL